MISGNIEGDVAEGVKAIAIAYNPKTLKLVPIMVWGRENFQKEYSPRVSKPLEEGELDS
jgi:hypothetical protein